MLRALNIAANFAWCAAGLVLIDACIDTGPLVCKIDPTCRKLTDDEIALAKPIFGDRVRYNDVLVFERHPAAALVLGIIRPGRMIASSADNNIYLPDVKSENYDFEKKLSDSDGFKGFSDRRSLVHEFTHLAKSQTGFLSKGPYDLYDFNLEQSKPFEAYGREQQAEMIATYYTLARNVEQLGKFLSQRKAERVYIDLGSARSLIKRECQPVEDYAAKIREVFPVAKPSICQTLKW